MARWIGAALVALGMAGHGAESAWPLEAMTPDLTDKPSLQRGWRLYANYCLGCHSLKFQRYERTADDLGAPHDVVMENLVFTGQKIGGLMATAMPEEQAKGWFGAAPPDLTMVARVRGVDWLLTYLKAFYLDPTRPFGVNNKVYENVGMPHVMMELQGTQREVCKGYEPIDIVHGKALIGVPRTPQCLLEVDAGTGAYGEAEFDAAMHDLVNFLHYVGEPTRLERERIGVYVLAFLAVLFVFAFLLNREYWKDVP